MGKIVLTGTNGNLGRVAAQTLIKICDKKDLIFTSSKLEKIADLAEQGYECREANFNDYDQLVKSFAGGETLLLISLPQVGSKRRRLHTNAVLAARAAGIKRIVYTSITGCDNLENAGYEIADHRYLEYLIQAMEFDYVFMRNSQYAEAMVMAVKGAVENGGILRTGEGDGKMAYVSRKDCGIAAAYAAAGDYHNQVFYISGPRLCTVQDFCDVIAPAFGGKVKVEFISDEDSLAAFDAMGVPRTTEGEWLTEEAKNSPFCSLGMVSFAAAIRKGQMASCTDDFKKLTGMEPTSIEDIAANISDYFIGERNATES
ncbi:MAG: NAD(P)H-binding protein [Coriobacteriales bacterium]|jgi:NAD(P)H dehydrogenase (quinone)